MLADGWAVTYRTCKADGIIGTHPDSLSAALERQARADRAGLWDLATPPVLPFCFRHPDKCHGC